MHGLSCSGERSDGARQVDHRIVRTEPFAHAFQRERQSQYLELGINRNTCVEFALNERERGLGKLAQAVCIAFAALIRAPQQQAGVQMGFEQIAWENPRANQRVTVEFRARATEHFYGRSASELWEALAGSSQCTSPASSACRPGIDYNPGDTTAFPYPGVTETQEYASFGGDAGLNVQVGKYARFRGLFGLLVDEPHFITYSGAGIKLSE